MVSSPPTATHNPGRASKLHSFLLTLFRGKERVRSARSDQSNLVRLLEPGRLRSEPGSDEL